MKRLATIVIIVGLCSGALAGEMRTWHLADGRTLEAVFERFQFDKIVLKDADGKELIIPKSFFELSDADREYLELENPPELAITFLKKIHRKEFTLVQDAEDRPAELRATFGARVVQKSNQDYNFPLTVEYFAIGREREGDKFILLDRASTTFTPTKENKRTLEFRSSRIVRMLDMWDDNQNYSRRGENYYGFIISVKDKRGKVVVVDASNDWLDKHLDKLEKLGVGNYMDDTCTRTFPTRPKSYIAVREAGRN